MNCSLPTLNGTATDRLAYKTSLLVIRSKFNERDVDIKLGQSSNSSVIKLRNGIVRNIATVTTLYLFPYYCANVLHLIRDCPRNHGSVVKLSFIAQNKRTTKQTIKIFLK
jgi:hypothetical protein